MDTANPACAQSGQQKSKHPVCHGCILPYHYLRHHVLAFFDISVSETMTGPTTPNPHKNSGELPSTMDVLPDCKSKSSRKSAPLHVCIIGGGPAAMFFCHAWNQQKKSTATPHQKLQDLDITCFEMKSMPGGIWRAPSNRRDHVYEELWTNGVAHNYEFQDYTFDEHFKGRPPTIFLPLRDVNKYLFGRVT